MAGIILTSSCLNKKNFNIELNIAGGFAGFKEKFILKNENLTYINGTVIKHKKIPQNKMEKLREIIKRINTAEVPYIEAYPDSIIYEIVINGKRITYIPSPTFNVKDLDEFIKILKEIIQY